MSEETTISSDDGEKGGERETSSESTSGVITDIPSKHMNLSSLCKERANQTTCEITRFPFEGKI